MRNSARIQKPGVRRNDEPNDFSSFFWLLDSDSWILFFYSPFRIPPSPGKALALRIIS
jgi:hypothetical protein